MVRRLALVLAAAALAFPAAAVARDDTIKSFDGTKIALSFFPAPDLKHGQRTPTIMIGPGWSQARSSADDAGLDALGYAGPKVFLDAGYNVLTWDPRGWGVSGGAGAWALAGVRSSRIARGSRAATSSASSATSPASRRRCWTAPATRGWGWRARATAVASSSSPPGATSGSTRSFRSLRGTRS